LNDANWLVYSAIAYDCIYNDLSAAQRARIENGAFRPLCNYLTHDLKDWFNLIHNHGVWACAAVGMTGLAIGDDDMVQQALMGTDKNGKGGFMAQLNNLFSPDGYYTEGPYYARYALLPFYLFAQSLHINRPSLKIFDYRNRILEDAFYAAIQQTNTDGAFFPVNDAIKDKTYVTSEMVMALSIAFGVYGHDKSLFSIAEKQKKVLLNGNGLMLAAALVNTRNKISAFPYKTVEYTDGANGDEGGVSILRNGKTNSLSTLFFKYAAHGLSHGHYDCLNIILYDNGNEILTDYGAVRFLNIEQKDGGRYLPENKSFAMQTVAHNTVVVDETSHFNANEKEADKYNSEKWFSVFSNGTQAVSAVENNAYKNVKLHRTLITINDKEEKPVIIDIFNITSPQSHQYDLPFWYSGQLIGAGFSYHTYSTNQSTVGTANGYQHIWKEAEGKTDKGIATVSLLNGASFYSISALADTTTKLFFIRSGATDPSFNLRHEPGFMIRKQGGNQLFVNVIERHGSFNSVAETSSDSKPGIERIEVIINNESYTIAAITFRGNKYVIAISNKDNRNETKHTISIQDKPVKWQGPFYFLKTTIINNKN
jgi:hypothetical protein